MSTKRKRSDFRFKGKKIGLTYSCPVNAEDNPIKSNEELLEILTARWGESKYVIGKEKHESGKHHYHVYMHLDKGLDKTTPDFADINFDDDRPFKDVHPNIVKSPGNGWISYCQKEKEFITNLEQSHWGKALAMATAEEAIEYLWIHQASDMCKQGRQIEANIRDRFKPPTPEAKLYFGPWPERYFFDVDMTTHAVCVWGPPGTGKTQFIRYYMAHTYGEYGYAKSHVENLKNLDLSKPFIFDEVLMTDKEPRDSREITDVENGGVVSARYNTIDIPPGTPRVFISNYEWPFKNPQEAVYDRRVKMYKIE